MKFDYRVVATNQLLDEITITGKTVTYKTGKAKPMVERLIAGPGGVAQAQAQLQSWSNGYVSTSAISG